MPLDCALCMIGGILISEYIRGEELSTIRCYVWIYVHFIINLGRYDINALLDWLGGIADILKMQHNACPLMVQIAVEMPKKWTSSSTPKR
jgi:hypothetical protein